MRTAALLAGLLALVSVWIAPLPQLGGHAFWAHMTMHVVVVAVAAPLLALGVAGGPLDPVPRAPGLFSPIPASILELVVVWAWHAPVLHHAARHTAVGVVIEQSTFVASALFLWLAAFGGDAEHARSRRAAGIIGLLLTSMHMTLLGALLALATRPLFHHAHGPECLGPLDDQHLGGAIMLVVGGLSYLAGGLWLTLGLTQASPVVGETT